MRVLVAPLNWGLGHASRCIPLIIEHLRAGDEVELAGDGDALLLLRKHFPGLPYHRLAPLRLRYSAGNSQVWAMLKALPHLLRWARRDHRALDRLLQTKAFDEVISDNRFGCFTRRTRCTYLTHQVHIVLPAHWRWLEPLAERCHGLIISRYGRCLVPDYAGESNLSGRLSHNLPPATQRRLTYIGPLSRFDRFRDVTPNKRYQVVAVLSGLEPQRTLLEQRLLHDWQGKEETVLIVRGIIGAPPTCTKRKNVTLAPYLGNEQLAACLRGATTIIARSGYSTVMDLATLNVLDKARLIPTPGQPEQEYLGEWVRKGYEGL